MKKIKIAYFGSNAFSATVLQKIIQDSDIDIKYVVTKTDKKQGRGIKLFQNPVSAVADKYNIPLFQVSSLLKNPTQLRVLDFNNVDVCVVVSFAYIIPYDILRRVKKGFINLHPSMLPKYRGPSPIQSAISNGDTSVGISIMILNEGMDSGPILNTCTLKINSNQVYPEIEKKVIEKGTKLLTKSIKQYVNNRLTAIPQSENSISYCKMIKKEDGFMTLKEKPLHIYNCYRAYYNWPGIYTKIENLEEYSGFKLKVGDKQTFVKLKQIVLNPKGNLSILQLQLPNKPVISYKDFINGYKL